MSGRHSTHCQTSLTGASLSCWLWAVFVWWSSKWITRDRIWKVAKTLLCKKSASASHKLDAASVDATKNQHTHVGFNIHWVYILPGVSRNPSPLQVGLVYNMTSSNNGVCEENLKTGLDGIHAGYGILHRPWGCRDEIFTRRLEKPQL